MARSSRLARLPAAVRGKPLQTAKFVGILLAIVLAIAGFLRILEVGSTVSGPPIWDGQLLALLLLPLVSLGLVAVVFVETVVSLARSLRTEQTLADQVTDRPGYVVLRGAEAGLAVLGVLLMLAAVPQLFAETTPAPAGVGIMLFLFVIGLGILGASFVRATAEVFFVGTR